MVIIIIPGQLVIVKKTKREIRRILEAPTAETQRLRIMKNTTSYFISSNLSSPSSSF